MGALRRGILGLGLKLLGLNYMKKIAKWYVGRKIKGKIKDTGGRVSKGDFDTIYEKLLELLYSPDYSYNHEEVLEKEVIKSKEGPPRLLYDKTLEVMKNIKTGETQIEKGNEGEILLSTGTMVTYDVLNEFIDLDPDSIKDIGFIRLEHLMDMLVEPAFSKFLDVEMECNVYWEDIDLMLDMNFKEKVPGNHKNYKNLILHGCLGAAFDVAKDKFGIDKAYRIKETKETQGGQKFTVRISPHKVIINQFSVMGKNGLPIYEFVPKRDEHSNPMLNYNLLDGFARGVYSMLESNISLSGDRRNKMMKDVAKTLSEHLPDPQLAGALMSSIHTTGKVVTNTTIRGVHTDLETGDRISIVKIADQTFSYFLHSIGTEKEVTAAVTRAKLKRLVDIIKNSPLYDVEIQKGVRNYKISLTKVKDLMKEVEPNILKILNVEITPYSQVKIVESFRKPHKYDRGVLNYFPGNEDKSIEEILARKPLTYDEIIPRFWELYGDYKLEIIGSKK
jgi:hypothetical protein